MSKEVIVLSSPSCAPCNLLKKKLTEEEIDFTNLSLSDGDVNEIRSLMSISKVRKVPQLFIRDGAKVEFIFHGYNSFKIEEIKQIL